MESPGFHPLFAMKLYTKYTIENVLKSQIQRMKNSTNKLLLPTCSPSQTINPIAVKNIARKANIMRMKPIMVF